MALYTRMTAILLFILLFILESDSKKVGGILGRGSSGARTSSRTGGGGTFGSSGSHTSRTGFRNPFSSTSGTYRTSSSGGYYPGRVQSGSGTGWNNNRYGSGGSYGGYGVNKYTSGRSKPRFSASTFKSAALGAATGILAYEAGKHLIRSIASPFTYHGRSYYWGSDYYRGPSGGQMCRRPITANDATFGDIYMSDRVSRPKEIVWSCGWNEYCCGMDCCYRGDATSYKSFTLGTLLIFLIVSGCCFLFCYFGIRRLTEGMRQRNPQNCESAMNNAQYVPGYVPEKPIY